MNVYFTNLGCKLNQAETEAFVRSFVAAGHQVVGALELADLHVVNSCTVTHKAARDSRKVARRGGRLARPTPVRTVMTGCYATGSSEEAVALAGVDLVVPNREKRRLYELVCEAFPEWVETDPATSCGEATVEVPVSYVPLPTAHTRAALKIEDGCNMRCSFCVIPLVRGSQVSRSPEEVLAEFRSIAGLGVREIVITGVQISAYRHRDGAQQTTRLVDLVERLLDETRGARIRLTSIAPWQFDERLFELLGDPRICRHVHLSLQSGCDETLERMQRPYTGEKFASLVARLRREVSGLAVTTDVIVGFPGESARDFEASLAFVDRMSFAKVHAFAYSPRAGTSAFDMQDPVEPGEIKARMGRMLEVGRVREVDFHRSQIGETVEVLWEDERDGVRRGTSDNYLRVFAEAEELRPGNRDLEPWVITDLRDGGVTGRPVASSSPRGGCIP